MSVEVGLGSIEKAPGTNDTIIESRAYTFTRSTTAFNLTSPKSRAMNIHNINESVESSSCLQEG